MRAPSAPSPRSSKRTSVPARQGAKAQFRQTKGMHDSILPYPVPNKMKMRFHCGQVPESLRYETNSRFHLIPARR
jgi:hypothetical protein